jgi:hypothetical protein
MAIATETKHDFDKLTEEGFQTLMDISVIVAEKICDVIYAKVVKIAIERDGLATGDDVIAAGRQIVQEIRKFDIDR